MVNTLYGLRELRKARGLSPKDLGRQIGVATSAIWSYENGTKKLSVDHARRLAHFFDVQPELLTDE